MKHLISLTLLSLLLSGCSSLQEDVAYFDTLSCTQLAMELGRYKEREEEAREEEIVSSAVMIFTDGEDSNEATIDSTVASYKKEGAKDRVREIRRIYTERGCEKF